MSLRKALYIKGAFFMPIVFHINNFRTSISAQPIHYFKRYGVKTLRHHDIIRVRGFLQNYRGKRIINLRYPVQLGYLN